jgi:hypothetical protein
MEQVLEDLQTKIIVLWVAAGPAPIDGLLKSNELLVEKVLPKLGIELEQVKPQLRDEFSGRGWRD